MQVQMNNVEAGVAGTNDAHDGVEVGSVVVAQTACLMDDIGDLRNIRVKQTDGVRVGQHQTGGVFVSSSAQRIEVYAAVFQRRDADDLNPAMVAEAGLVPCAESGTDFGALKVTVCLMVGFDQHQTGQLAVCSGSRLEGHIVHAGDLAQVRARSITSRQPCAVLCGWRGMDCSKTGEGGDLVVDLWVVLHGTGA